MKNLSIALLIALCLGLTFTAVAEEERHIKLKIATDGEMHDIDASDLEVGESRQFISDSGKEVVITRTEEGFSITVDGEELDLGGHTSIHAGHGKKVIIKQGAHGGDGEGVKIIKKRMRMDGGDEDVMIWHGEDGEVHEIDGDHAIFMSIDRPDVAQHLQDSGALEGLSDEQRQRILDALEELHEEHEIHKEVHKHVVVEVESDDQDA